ncbi:hypothetical protein DTO271G3_7410 [Paecilomyces variotii]|nr:hypothetical protein DTO271G3_7410 [Paecilomyces variotii]
MNWILKQKKKEHVLFTLPLPEPSELLNRLREKFPDIDFQYIQFGTLETFRNPPTIPRETIAGKTVLVTAGALPATAADCPDLELIHFISAGINHIQKHPIYTNSDIPLATVSGIHGPPIAEWVLMTTLLRNREYERLYEAQKEHRWMEYPEQRPRDMVGQRIGILGYGSIGRQVANVSRAMGMEVLAYTATPKSTPESRKDHGFVVPGTGDADGTIPSQWFSGTDKADLHNFLSQDLDILLISVPLTPQTHHLISKAEFEVLAKRRTFVSNVARGPVIDQSALVEALKKGDIRGAAVDVTDPEPLPADDPLWDAPNVVITPHVSAMSAQTLERVFQVIEVNLERKEKGERLINIVNRKKGY